MRTKRMLSLALALVLALGCWAGLAPEAAKAAGVAGPDGLPEVAGNTVMDGNYNGGSRIYFGKAPQGSAVEAWGSATKTPIQWRVLSLSDSELFLLSEKILTAGRFDGTNSDWSNSDARDWLNSDRSFKDSFSVAEWTAANTTTNFGEEYKDGTWLNSEDKVFLLSKTEATTFFTSDAARKTLGSEWAFGNDGYSDAKLFDDELEGAYGYWWLRSPAVDSNISAREVGSGGGVGAHPVHGVLHGLRPAFKLDRSSVLFTSVASSAGAVAAQTSPVAFTPPTTAENLKLTLVYDSFSNNFAVAETAVSGAPSGSVTLNYSGAAMAASNFLRVKLVQGNDIKYTAVPISGISSATGQFTLTLPSDMPIGNYTAYAWVEQGNLAYETNCGSTPDTFMLTVSAPSGSNPPPAPTGFTVNASANPTKGGSVSGGGSYTSGQIATLTAKANVGYTFTGWSVDGTAAGNANPLTLTIMADTGVVANFEEIYTGEENTYPDPVNGNQTATIGKNGEAVVNLMSDNARKIVGEVKPQSKGTPGSRVARLNVDTGKANALCLRMSAAGLAVLKTANIDAFEVRSDAADIYLDKQMLDTIYTAAASGKASYRIIVTPGENSLTVQGDLGDAKPQQKGKGLLSIRLPLEDAVSVANTPSFYDRQKQELILAPEAYGNFTLTKRAENTHWAADYMEFAKITGKPDDAYKDKAGKTYTRAQLAQKLYDELLKNEALPTAMRAAYPFKDTVAVSRAAVVLQQAGIISPLSTGMFGGNATLTNAQAAAWLARLEWLNIDPLSPYGWAFSDDGVSMFYSYTGSMINYKTILGGKAYTFDKDGFLTK